MWQANNIIRNKTSTLGLIEVLITAGRMKRILCSEHFHSTILLGPTQSSWKRHNTVLSFSLVIKVTWEYSLQFYVQQDEEELV
jgi:hypothetical protein